MRVLVHLNSLELGGTQLNAVDFAAAARAHGVESILLGDRATLSAAPNLLDYAVARGVAIRVYEPAAGMRAHAAQLTAIASELHVDVVHVYGMWGAARPVFWGPARRGRLPWVQTVYEMSMSPVVLRHMPLIVGTGYLRDEQAGRPGGVTLISPPVDLDRDAPGRTDVPDLRADAGLGDGAILCIVSRLDSRMKSYSIGVAVETMRTLGAEGITLCIVGSGDAESDLRASAADVNGAVGRDAVRFLGAMTDPRAAYMAADVVLGMGGSAARALAFGKPLIVQGEAGWSQVFEPSSAETLARSSYWSPDSVADPVGDLRAAIDRVLADPRERAELGTFGRAFAQERFGLVAMTAKLVEVYHSAVADHDSAAWWADLPREGRRLAEKIGRTVARARTTERAA